MLASVMKDQADSQQTARTFPTVRMNTRVAVALAAAVLVFWLGVRAFNPHTGTPPHIDSGVYAATATHLLHGRVLYREVWDHKPPVTHVINAAALALGDHTINSVRNLERVLAGLGTVLVLLLAVQVGAPMWAGAGSAILFAWLFFHPNVMRGNQPEEYGSILTLAAVACCLRAARSGQGHDTLWSVLAGMGFGLAVLTKETFLLGAPPWLAWLLWEGRHDRKAMVRRGASFVAGAALPGVLFFLYLWNNNAFADWLDVLRFNFSYARFDANNAPNPNLAALLLRGLDRGWPLVLAVSKLGVGLGALAVASLASRRVRQEMGALPVAAIGFFLCSLAAVSMGRRYGYYYLQLVPSCVVLALVGMMALIVLLRGRRVAGAIVATALLLGLAALDGRELLKLASRLAQPRKHFEPATPIVAHIRAHSSPTDTIWNLVRDQSVIYAHTDRLAPTRFFYVSANLFRDLPAPDAVRDQIVRAVTSNPPRFIVFDGDYAWLDKVALGAWFREKYRKTRVDRLWELSESESTVTPSSAPAPGYS